MWAAAFPATLEDVTGPPLQHTMRARPPRRLLLALAVASCAGGIGAGPEPRPPSPVEPAEGPMPPAKPGAMKPETAPPGACPARAVPWRGSLLTREQYINAARDLLGFD